MGTDLYPIKISFVIPVYNAEKYLIECLDSVVCQLEGNELILINDGSTDSSGQICDKCAASNESILVLHIENHGVAYARNLGVSRAKGEYIVFLDADDYINRDFSARFAEQALDAELIFFPVRKQYGEQIFVPMGDGLVKDRLAKQPASAVLEFIAHCPKFPASPWGKLVHRDFLIRNQIRFPLDVGHEDYDWTYSLLRHLLCFEGEKTNPFPYIKNADLFALYSAYEGFPMVIGEAQALDTFVLTTNYAAAKEQISPEQGIIAESDEEFYQELKRLILCRS